LLPKIDSQTKLFELLVLDDEEIAELAESGMTGELALDDVATMSVKELRAALRESRAEREAFEKRSEKSAARTQALESELEHLRMTPATISRAAEEAAREAGAAAAERDRLKKAASPHEIQKSVEELEGRIGEWAAFAETCGQPVTPGEAEILRGQIRNLCRAAMNLRDGFDAAHPLPDEKPEWQRWHEARERGETFIPDPADYDETDD
jgi:chromosome segregation ATPase